MEVKNIFLEDFTDKEISANARIAVHLHAFYQDLLPEFVSYFNNIPVPFDLFVSIPENISYNHQETVNLLQGITQVQKINIQQTPNRGRDIAPMACTFAQELQNYDILLHLHTKKSPHNAGQDGWRPFILEHLLGSTAIVNGIITLLQNEAGMITSADYLCNSTATGWCHEKNVDLAQEVLDKAGIKINLQKDYPTIDFPQGTMFWTRTDYIRGFFDLNLTYEDFNPEPIPIDGTIAHALERLFFIWGANSPYHPMKIYTNRSELYLQQYCKYAIRDLLEQREEWKNKAVKRLKKIRKLVWLTLVLVFCLALVCIK